MLRVRPILHENQDACAAKPFRLSWTIAFLFSLQLYEYFNRKTRWSASACVRACVTGNGGRAARSFTPTGTKEPLSLHTTLQRARSSHQPEPDSPPAYWVTKSRWHVYAITQKTQHRRRRATFVPVVWRNSHARTPCSLTTCCSRRQIVSLGRGAQTGGGNGLTLLPPAPAVLWVYFSSSPHPDFAARK